MDKFSICKSGCKNFMVYKSGQWAEKVGLSPGSLIHFGESKTTETRITYMDYGIEDVYESSIEEINNEILNIPENKIRWINVYGLKDVRKIAHLCEKFQIHPLNIEDILNAHERPKYQENEEYIFISIDRQIYDENNNHFSKEQVGLVLGKNYVITFNEGDSDAFDPIRLRIKGNKSKTRKNGPDYLLYTLLDIIVDEYFVLLEKIEEKIEILEDELIVNPTPETLQKIQTFKKKMLYLNRSTWPMREVIGSLFKLESNLINESMGIYIHDLHDHIIQIIDTTEVMRDLISSLHDIYLSSVSNRLNTVMKLLTIISTIFIPLSFITSFYGMNFKHMPELYYRWSYPTVIGFIICVVTGMLLFFKKKKWI